MMQRNESALLEPWILYHADLFGMANLEIIDHASDDPWVLATLARYEAQGVTVHRQYREPSDFLRKGEIVRQAIEAWDRERVYDYALPLDCDEFVVFCDAQISSDATRIHDYLDRIRDIPATLHIERMFLNVPDEPGYFLPQVVGKSLFQAGAIRALDNGFHNPVSCHEAHGRVHLGVVHLHNRAFEDVRARAAEKLAGLVDINDQEALRGFDGEGRHLTSYFFMEETFFRLRYRREPAVYVPAFLTHLKGLGISWAACFGCEPRRLPPVCNAQGFLVRLPEGDDATRLVSFHEGFYLDLYPDVRESGFWALSHFMSVGYREGRAGAPPGAAGRN
ncbi:glycosyltransferase family 2 protein [Ameyamaea chiangmaiensis]|uniref:Glycosyltransferase family 2 protein n=1 Tax=Ameyamaea chiangmaiensis TaxID=442969 RepID=A0A850PAH2_9PROT|nr:glycosyltransferase family 2 protein [Ameyamaea chiangmaiensis]MBS4076242.1 glycosyltransferase family 2 protein [Ameyamaea chiangmaiensis]NVN39699.1 glycosyltransferase family 2 protein [Ameyamaea chiangmaiensis]